MSNPDREYLKRIRAEDNKLRAQLAQAEAMSLDAVDRLVARAEKAEQEVARLTDHIKSALQDLPDEPYDAQGVLEQALGIGGVHD